MALAAHEGNGPVITEWHKRATLGERAETFLTQYKEVLAAADKGLREMPEVDTKMTNFLKEFLTGAMKPSEADITDLIRAKDALLKQARNQARNSERNTESTQTLIEGHAALVVLVEQLDSPQGVQLFNELTKRAFEQNKDEETAFTDRVAKAAGRFRDRAQGR